MKSLVHYILYALITVTLSGTALADVKVKIRQTMSGGQATENTTYIKGKRQRSEQSLGGVPTVTLTQCDLKRSVQLNPQTQIYLVNSWAADETAPTQTTVSGNTRTEVRKGGVVTTTVTVKDTGETRKMFGYTARHLIVTTETEASADACTPMKKMKMVTDGWYIDAAFALDCDNGAGGAYFDRRAAGGCRDRQEFKQVGTARRGYPVIEKMTMFDENGRESFTLTNEVLELSNTTLDAALFEIPQGWRETTDAAALYAPDSRAAISSPDAPTRTPAAAGLGAARTTPATTDAEPVGPKKAGVVRIGLVEVKTGAVGDGMNAAELAAAVRGALPQYLKGTKIELVGLDARLASAVESEAREKECDFVLWATVSHKKGGGGFGFGKMLGSVVGQTGIGQTGSTVGNVAGQVATQSIVAATSNIKPKDELTLEIRLQAGGTVALAKQFRTKAKSAGEDIVSPLVEQAAQALVETAGTPSA